MCCGRSDHGMLLKQHTLRLTFVACCLTLFQLLNLRNLFSSLYKVNILSLPLFSDSWQQLMHCSLNVSQLLSITESKEKPYFVLFQFNDFKLLLPFNITVCVCYTVLNHRKILSSYCSQITDVCHNSLSPCKVEQKIYHFKSRKINESNFKPSVSCSSLP